MGQAWTMLGRCLDHVWTMCIPCLDHVLDMCWSCLGHVQIGCAVDMSGDCVGDVLVMFGTYAVMFGRRTKNKYKG